MKNNKIADKNQSKSINKLPTTEKFILGYQCLLIVVFFLVRIIKLGTIMGMDASKLLFFMAFASLIMIFAYLFKLMEQYKVKNGSNILLMLVFTLVALFGTNINN